MQRSGECEIVAVIYGSSNATDAIVGISAVIRSTSKFGRFAPYIGAISGVLWFAGAGVKLISENGKYGVGIHLARNPITGDLKIGMGVPWRQ
ncbi:MAG: hypothetical protein IMZ40_00400 [Bacilli bacterium]|nr:hypothetical protein [Bacilli bacterium]